jgi:hypothetical protein
MRSLGIDPKPAVEFPKGGAASADQIGRRHGGLEADSLLRSKGRDEVQCNSGGIRYIHECPIPRDRLDEFRSGLGEIPKSFRHFSAELPVLKVTLQRVRDAIEVKLLVTCSTGGGIRETPFSAQHLSLRLGYITERNPPAKQRFSLPSSMERV